MSPMHPCHTQPSKNCMEMLLPMILFCKMGRGNGYAAFIDPDANYCVAQKMLSFQVSANILTMKYACDAKYLFVTNADNTSIAGNTHQKL